MHTHCARMHTCIDTCTHAHTTHMNTHTTHTCGHKHTYAHTHTHICTHTYICTQTHTHRTHTRAEVCTSEQAASRYTCTHKHKANTCVHRTRTCTHTSTHLCRQVHTHCTHTTVPHTHVHRHAGEPTPGTQTCTHTRARLDHTDVCVHTHTSTHRVAQTPKSIHHHAETHTRRYAHARTLTQDARTLTRDAHTGGHLLRSAPRGQDSLRAGRKEIPTVPPLRLQINRANPEPHRTVPSCGGSRSTRPSFLWGQFFLEPLPRWADTSYNLGQALSHPFV